MASGKPATILAGTVVLATGLHSLYPYWYRDIKTLRQLKAVGESIGSLMATRTLMVDIFEQTVDRNHYKPFIIYEDTVHSYGDIEKMANRMALHAREQGLKCGDRVALMMSNEPAFVWAWLGFSKLGIECAFINHNLRSKSLVHCVDVGEVKVLFIGKGKELVQSVHDVMDEFNNPNLMIWSVGNQSTPDGIVAVDDLIMTSACDRPPSHQFRSNITPSDTTVYIYTSGTTGLPKASKIVQSRLIGASHALDKFIGTDDVVYITTPLYHAVGFILALLNVIRTGATCVMSRKFSVRKFWPECCKHDVTVIFYVGELCRYLLSAPKRPEDTMHKIKYAIGNGLQADIWSKFRTRFRIPNIVEYFAATDLPFMALNSDNRVGAVGRFSPMLKKIYGFELVECDLSEATPIRDKSGRCVPVKFGKPGLLIVAVNERFRFDGYRGDKKMTEKKFLRNVFKEGDVFVNSGDLLALDESYYLYFVDRLGDTFRWQGENVATTEVSQVLTSHAGVQESNVYGVTVPGHNGRAGMAAMVLKDGLENFDFKQFYSYVHSKLPAYAAPKFLRIKETLSTTGTYKYTKTDLVKEGFDPATVKDAIFFSDPNRQSYSKLNGEAYRKIVSGVSRL